MWIDPEDTEESVLLEHATGYGVNDSGFGLWITPAGNLAFIRVDPGQVAEI